MKISERLALLKAGYTKDDINAMIDEEAKIVENTDDKTYDDSANKFMNVITSLASEVKDLKEAVYSENIKNTEINKTSQKSVDDMLAELFNSAKKEG